MWDEFVIGGEVQETSKKNVLKAISDQDMIQEVNIRYSNLNLAFFFKYSIKLLTSDNNSHLSCFLFLFQTGRNTTGLFR